MNMKKYSPSIKSSYGFTIIEVMIAMAIMMVVVLGIMSLNNSQQKQSKSLSQKQELIDLKNALLSQITKSDVCSFHLKDKVFNAATTPTQQTPSPTIISFPQLNHAADPNSATIAKVGEKLPGTMTNLKVQSITFKNIFATGNLEEYRGVFEISMEPSSLALSLKPIQLPVALKTDPASPLNAKKIIECVTALDNIPMNLGTCDDGAYLVGYDADNSPICKHLPICEAGKVLQGFDSMGEGICVRLKYSDLLFTELKCPANQYQVGIGTSGEPLCANLPSEPPGADCSFPDGMHGATRPGPACPQYFTGTITYKCVKPVWQTINTCKPLPPCKQKFYDPKVFCNGEYRYVRQSQAVPFCIEKGYETGVKLVEHRTGPAVCQWEGSGWGKFNQDTNGTLGVVECRNTKNCTP